MRILGRQRDQNRLQLLVGGTTAFEVLRSGIQLGVFDALHNVRRATLSELALALDLEEQSARVLLDGLVALKLVRRRGSDYSNSRAARTFLVSSAVGFLGPAVEMQSRIVNRGIVDLAQSLREGTNIGLTRFEGTGRTIYDRLEADEGLNEFFSTQWSSSSRHLFEAVLQSVDFSKLKHVLDVGGGDGQNALQLARRYPHLRITMLDKARAERAVSNIRDAGVQSQVQVIHGDFLDYAFPEDCDAVLLLHVFELLSLEQNLQLLKKCCDSLPMGGSALVYSYGYRGSRRRVDTTFLSAYFHAVATGAGMLYEREAMEKCARDVGFAKVQHLSQGVPSDHVMILASK